MGKIKLCECGCGMPAPIATYTNKRLRYKKGTPVRFIRGHWVRIKKGNFKDRTMGNNSNWKGGISLTKLYHVWSHMMDRCYNPKCQSYVDYGGRGIDVYEEWHNVENFIKWSNANGWDDINKLEIDRKNNNSGYAPHNCRFTDRKTNARNTRASKIWHIEGRSYPSSYIASKKEHVDNSTIVRWCNGGVQHGIYYPPKNNCRSEKLYK